jgi:60 kDa SS-A/Ro ribonucleoprotein
MVNFRKLFSTRKTPQSQAVPGTPMVPNSAGGFAFALDDWARLDRFLVIGSAGGTYYISEQKLTLENAQAVMACVDADGARTVARIVEISEAGRAPKNAPAIYALAIAASAGDEATRKAALKALPRVCRIGTHLYQFAEFVEGFRGWGRALRRAVADWYLGKAIDDLVLQAIKYKGRAVGGADEGGTRWSHRDLLRLSHPKAAKDDAARAALFDRIVRPDGTAALPAALAQFAASERLAKTGDPAEAARLITEHKLPREAVPTHLLNSKEVWAALLDDMPMTAMIRSLGKMSEVGLLQPKSAAAKIVAERLGDAARLKRARIHPLAVLLAQSVYAQGRGFRGKLAWQPVPAIVDALDEAFYRCFAFVEPTGKRIMLALDVSGSMGTAFVAGTPLTAREAAAAMAMVTLAAEGDCHVVGFTAGGHGAWKSPGRGVLHGYTDGLSPLGLSRRQRLDDAVKAIASLDFGGTDCALPMLYAIDRKLEVDAFVIYTDSETWAGAIHPVQALQEYRRKSGIPARLVVVGMTSNGFSIADPKDGGMLDVVGFDAAAPAVIASFVAGTV